MHAAARRSPPPHVLSYGVTPMPPTVPSISALPGSPIAAMPTSLPASLPMAVPAVLPPSLPPSLQSLPPSAANMGVAHRPASSCAAVDGRTTPNAPTRNSPSPPLATVFGPPSLGVLLTAEPPPAAKDRCWEGGWGETCASAAVTRERESNNSPSLTADGDDMCPFRDPTLGGDAVGLPGLDDAILRDLASLLRDEPEVISERSSPELPSTVALPVAESP